MNGGWMAVMIRRRVFGVVAQFRQTVFDDVLPRLDDPEQRAGASGRAYAQHLMATYGGEDIHFDDVAEWVRDHELEVYEGIIAIRQTMLNLFAAGLFHLTEQKLKSIFPDHDETPVEGERLGKIARWYRDRCGLDFTGLVSYARIEELRLVANVVKHAEGSSAEDLRRQKPDIFRDPRFAVLDAEWRTHGKEIPLRPLVEPLAGEGLFVTDDDLREYFDAVEQFFRELLAFFEARQHEYFPRPT